LALGQLYLQGKLLKPEQQSDVIARAHHLKTHYIEAHKWFKSAAQAGNASAQYYLGILYHAGYGVTKNLDQARDLYEKAAQQGDQNAKIQLAKVKAETEKLSLDYKALSTPKLITLA